MKVQVISQAVQMAGALLVLAGFVLAQLDVLDESAYAYVLPNLVGSAALTVTGVLSPATGDPRPRVRRRARHRGPVRPAPARRATQHSLSYLLLDLGGSALLTVLAWLHHQWGFVVLQGVWTLVTVWSLARLVGRRGPGDAGSTDPS